MEYSFDIEIAKNYGVEEAIMIKNFQFWIMKNKANSKNFYDNKTWTYNSNKAYAILFPFWTEKQIRRILLSLISQNVLIKGNYNNNQYDRTLWYSFSNEVKFILLNGKMENPEQENENSETVNSIQILNTDNKPDKERVAKKFIKPMKEEISEYLKTVDFTIDIDAFIDHYETVGWKVNRNPMKDWEAAVRTWKRNEIKFSNNKSFNGNSYYKKQNPPPKKGTRATGEELERLNAIRERQDKAAELRRQNGY